MPPKTVDLKTLAAKRDSAIRSLYELFEEFQLVISVQPELDVIENVYRQIEPKYRNIKKQIETIEDRIIDNEIASEDPFVVSHNDACVKVKRDYLKCTQSFAAYQKTCLESKAKFQTHSQEHVTGHLENVNTALQKMVAVLDSKSTSQNHGLEKLSVPTWDGDRKSYSTWKNEFNNCMKKYKQDKDEQLQRLRKALPKHLFWTNQIKYSQTIAQAWEILDNEFSNKRKLMDEILKDIVDLKPVKRDAKSLAFFAAKILSFANNMEQNGCSVIESAEAPFIMSQLLSKLDAADNVEFGREMTRVKKDENIANLVEWLNNEATLRSRGGKTYFGARTESHPVEVFNPNEVCPLGCKSKHLLTACPLYQSASTNKKWEIVRRHKRCRKCLQSHHTNNCSKPDGKTCDKCEKRHHKSLHDDGSRNDAERLDNPQRNAEGSRQQEITTSGHVQQNGKIVGLIPIQKIKIKDNNQNLHEFTAMIDSGSNTSFLSKAAARKLGLRGCETHLTMNLAGGKKKAESSEFISITVVSPCDENIEKIVSVYTLTNLCNSAKTISKKTVNNFQHLRTVSNQLHLTGGKIDLLIGTDLADAFIDIHVIQGNPGEPIAKRNCFGWYLLGQINDSQSCSGIHSVDVGTISAEEDMKTLLTQDLLGIRPTSLCTCNDSSLKESKFIKSVAESTEMIDGRIQVRMPWNEAGPPLDSNYEMAYARMLSSEKNFQKRKRYQEIQNEVNKLIEQQFVKEVPPEQINHSEPEWYLPMHAVFAPDKSTKVRLVFDASAKGPKGKSLNEYLEKGPNYINSLPDVLIAWRLDQVAYASDIRKMFNQILIHPDDQVFHRFLWRQQNEERPRIYQWERLNFGDKPAPDIATGAINTLAKTAQERYPEAAHELQKHVYVDDIGGSKEKESQVKRIISDIDTILKMGKFAVKEWHSNCEDIDQTKEEITDFLGHRWNKIKDVFTFKKKEINVDLERLTKRICLASLARFWDPIGLTLPVTIEFRIDLQELWSSGYAWDELLSENMREKWMKNIQVLNKLLSFEFQRKLRPDLATGSPEIHGFGDGGEKAYGSVIFLRWKASDGSFSCIPLMAKAFVAPLKTKSVPRLELMGCLSLIRLYRTCNEALLLAGIRNCKTVFWLDSQTVLAWIKSSPRQFKSFVSVRVAEIQETVDVSSFKYVKSEDNPADALTRGISDNQLIKWMKGPQFLTSPKGEYSNCRDPVGEIEETSEAKRERLTSAGDMEQIQCDVNTGEVIRRDYVLETLLQKSSSFCKVRRIIAFVLRFIYNARSKQKRIGPLSVEEIKESEMLLFKWSQTKLDISKLHGKLLAKEDDQGIVRAFGRLEKIRNLPSDMRNPIILPRNHPLVLLLLKHLHKSLGHCGCERLIHEARRKYWIIGLRRTVKYLTRTCVNCRKLRAKPLEQLMGQIPTIRVNPSYPAFSHTAMDMFGPLQIRLNRKTMKEAQVIIFTCMTCRAIHLELCTDRSTDTFIMAFRRFVSLRGHPLVCWSDCGTNFKGAQGYIMETCRNWEKKKIESVLSNEYSCQFQWLWNTPRASHMNGVVESLIKSVRNAIAATCQDRPFTEEQWRTSLAEIVYLVNSRPLYPSSANIWEEPPITPNDLIIGPHLPLPVEAENWINPRNLQKSIQQRVTEFWCAWQKYFAPTLLPRNKWFRARENLQVGDIVLELEGTPRRKWKMALVKEVFPGVDGLVRKVKIRTIVGEYLRPIHKLCLIATNQELTKEVKL